MPLIVQLGPQSAVHRFGKSFSSIKSSVQPCGGGGVCQCSFLCSLGVGVDVPLIAQLGSHSVVQCWGKGVKGGKVSCQWCLLYSPLGGGRGGVRASNCSAWSTIRSPRFGENFLS